MVKIRIYSPGKTKESWLEEALAEYLKRLKPVAQIEFIHPKTEKQYLEHALKEKRLLALDPTGKTLTSEQFSDLLFDEIEKGGAHLAFAIGAAEGLPKELLEKPRISLSSLTFTHQMVRLILIEQIYRAFEIQKQSGYHK